MNEQMFESELARLTNEETNWKKHGFVQKNLFTNRVHMRGVFERWLYVLDAVGTWEHTLQKHLNGIAKAKWSDSKYELATQINLEKLQKRLIRDDARTKKIILNWKVCKKDRLWFIKVIPLFRVTVVIPYECTDNKDYEPKDYFWTTGMKKPEELTSKDHLRDALIQMYARGPDYEDFLGRLIEVLRNGIDSSMQLVKKT